MYVFKKKLLNTLRDQIAARKAIPLNNAYLSQTLDDQKNILQAHIAHEEENAHALLLKIEQWNAHEDQKLNQVHQQQEKYTRALMVRTQASIEKIAAQEQYKVLMPDVLLRTQHVLQEQMNNDDTYNAFMHTMFTRIRKER